ncbi:hypothetical protein ABZ446_36210 [Streptomyces sp. NPDC005813]|uniref:hypothetical protein n=1 Tax=Streptomyces sp. NPDC005813 TaxID=3155592 RepID=UPI003406C82F
MAQVAPSDIKAAAVLLYGPHIDPVAVGNTALTSLGLDARIRVYDEELDALRHDGLLRSVLLTYRAGSVTAVLLALLAVVCELLLSAPERRRTASYLQTLGLGGRPAAAVHILELLPMVVAATVGGVALGLLLPSILGPALALRAFTGAPKPGSSPTTASPRPSRAAWPRSSSPSSSRRRSGAGSGTWTPY